MFFGVLLVLLGTLMLLDHLGVISGPVWGYFWPIVLVAIGVSIIIRGRRKKFF